MSETLSATIPIMNDSGAPETVSMGEARSNITEVTSRVRLQHRVVVLAHRGEPKAAIIPLDLLAAVQAAGGLEKAIDVLNKHVNGPETDGAPSQEG